MFNILFSDLIICSSGQDFSPINTTDNLSITNAGKWKQGFYFIEVLTSFDTFRKKWNTIRNNDIIFG